MPLFAEFVRFTADDPSFLDRRREAILAVKAAHPRLHAMPLISRDEVGTWTDVWIYEDEAAAEAANADAGTIEAFAAMARLLSDVEVTSGHVPDGSASPLG
ncbi:MAG: hypothetical protein PIR53_14465 [Nocardioides alkalitolerans]